jgi:hypothetical protein
MIKSRGKFAACRLTGGIEQIPGAVSVLLVCAHSLSRKARRFWAMKRNIHAIMEKLSAVPTGLDHVS